VTSVAPTGRIAIGKLTMPIANTRIHRVSGLFSFGDRMVAASHEIFDVHGIPIGCIASQQEPMNLGKSDV